MDTAATSNRKRFICSVETCKKAFSRKYDLRQHINSKHLQTSESVEKCFLCGQIYPDSDELQKHYAIAHKPSRRFIVKESAYQKNLLTYRYHFLPSETNFEEAQNGIRKKLETLIMAEAAKRIICKISLIFIAEMTMTDLQGEKIYRASIPFRAGNFITSASFSRNISNNIRMSFMKQRMALDDFMKSGSNWQFERALAFDIEIATIKPVRGGAGGISLDNFDNKIWLYNPTHKGKLCLLFCIAYFLLYGGMVNKKISIFEEWEMKKRIKHFDKKGINFPASVEDVKKFINKNPQLDLKVNILYRAKKDTIYPLEYGIGNGQKIVNLLLVPTNKGYHFLLIKDVDKYLKTVYNKGTGKKLSYKNAFYCLNCFNSFYSKQSRDNHTFSCIFNKARLEQVLAEPDNVVKFKNYEHQHELDYVAFLDFECILPDVTEKCTECSSLKCKCDASYIKNIHAQLPITYSFLILGPNDEIIHEKTHSGKDAHVHFLRHLLDEEESWIKPLLYSSQNMLYGPDDRAIYEAATNCYLCNIAFDDVIIKVRDHSHLNSAFLGAACQKCNLRRKKQKKLKIFMHNCSKYDMHFIIKALSSYHDEIKYMSILPYNGENFRTIKFNSFEFVDSLAFLQASLNELTANLKQTQHSYNILKQTYLVKKMGHFNRQRYEMVLSKSFFPYEYCSSLEKMISTKKLPSRKHFYSSLSENKISKEDHLFAQSVWEEFKCKNLVDYTEIYCKIDTVLLAEVFQTFRKKMMAFSGLDPAYYISLPAYGYDSMLKLTKAEIELPTSIDMVHLLEKCKRGGMSFINTRHLYSTNINAKDILYLDCNNLYGLAQMAKLPYKNFRWLTPQEINDFDPFQDLTKEKGFIIECDLHYPKRLHDTHSNLPLAPEVLEIGFDNLSPYSQEALRMSEGKRTYKDIKLMTTFHDRINYVTHGQNLQLYLELGMELKKIHRILTFEQDYIFVPFIEKTTKARMASTTKFEMNMFKLLVSKNKVT